MMKEILQEVGIKLRDYRPEEVDLGLIYLRMREYARDESATGPPEYAIMRLQGLTANVSQLPMGMLGGDMGFILLLGRLIREEILEKPQGLMQMAYGIVRRNSEYFANSPIQIDLRRRFYPFGVAMMALLDSEEDSIERYVLEEQIIFRLCDCEKILTATIPGVYSPEELTAGHLHSIGAFASMAERRRVYPHKAKQIRELIREANYDRKRSMPEDIILLDLQNGRPVSIDSQGITPDLILNLLNDAGRLAVCYDCKEMFASAIDLTEAHWPGMREAILSPQCSPHRLTGIALGLEMLLNDD